MLQPLGDRVLVKQVEAEEKSPGGIILPETAQEAPREGEVIAVGEGRMLDSGERSKMSVEEGDRVIYTQYGGTEVTIDGEEYLIVDENSILAVRE
ncbi:MAG: co-chaperone GroES [Armatimonadota bacterium]